MKDPEFYATCGAAVRRKADELRQTEQWLTGKAAAGGDVKRAKRAPAAPQQPASGRWAPNQINWVNKIFSDGVVELTVTPEGQRNDRLKGKAALRLLRIADTGLLDEDDVIAAVTEAARQCGQTDREIASTLRSARNGANTYGPADDVPEPTWPADGDGTTFEEGLHRRPPTAPERATLPDPRSGSRTTCAARGKPNGSARNGCRGGAGDPVRRRGYRQEPVVDTHCRRHHHRPGAAGVRHTGTPTRTGRTGAKPKTTGMTPCCCG